jgi:hypothetical protein
MNAFLLERLHPTGWRLGGELYWRLADASRESERLLREHDARGVRVLSVRINPEAILERLADPAGEVADES